MIIDDNKKFFLIEDNEDDTLTMTIHVPDILGPEVATIVVAMSLTDMLVSMLPEINRDAESYKNVERNAVLIPNEPD